MLDMEIVDLIMSLENTVKVPTRRYETMGYITMLKNEDLSIDDILGFLEKDVKEEVNEINDEMELFDEVLKLLPEGNVKDGLENWLVNKREWSI